MPNVRCANHCTATRREEWVRSEDASRCNLHIEVPEQFGAEPDRVRAICGAIHVLQYLRELRGQVQVVVDDVPTTIELANGRSR